MKTNQKDFIAGADAMLEWIQALPITGSARRMLDLHLYPLMESWEQIKQLNK